MLKINKITLILHQCFCSIVADWSTVFVHQMLLKGQSDSSQALTTNIQFLFYYIDVDDDWFFCV